MSYPKRPDQLQGPPSLLHNGYPILVPRGEVAEAWSRQLITSTADVNNTLGSTYPVILHDMRKDEKQRKTTNQYQH